MNSLHIGKKEGVLLRPGLKKYGYPISSIPKKPLEIQAIYALSVYPGKEILVRPLEGWEKFRHIKKRTFRQKLVDPMGYTEPHYRLLEDICQSLPAFQLQRPFEEGYTTFVEFVENHFQTNQ